MNSGKIKLSNRMGPFKDKPFGDASGNTFITFYQLKRKVTAIGLGIGFGLGAAVFAVFALGFGFATIAAALTTVVSTWLALLIVTLGLFAFAALLGLLAVTKIRTGTPPVPEQAIREAKLTKERLRANGR